MGAQKPISTRRIVALGSIGTAAEYYDFGLALSTSALVWPSVFFPSSDPTAALALSLGTWGVSLLFQPVGAMIFGHIGDRYGRKFPLIATLMAMGLGSIGLALTPSYASIGIYAPIIVVLLRIAQGIGFGGEWPGAVTWISEAMHDTGRRGFWTSWVAVSRTTGVVLATASFSYLSAVMAHSEFVATGWRWLFVLGAVIVVIGIVVRRFFVSDPVFEEVKVQNKVLRAPSLEVIRKFWKTILVLALSYSSVLTVIVVFQASYPLAYLAKLPVNPYSISAATMLLVVGRVWEIPTALTSGTLADRLGRKRVFIGGVLAMLVSVFVLIPLLSTGDAVLIVLGFAFMGVAVNIVSAAFPSLIAESFPTPYRYSGVGLAFNIPSIVGGLVSTFAVPYFLSVERGPIGAGPYIVGVVAGVTLVSLVFSFFIKETLGSDLRQI